MKCTPKRKEEIRKHRRDNVDGILFAVAIFVCTMTVLYVIASAFR